MRKAYAHTYLLLAVCSFIKFLFKKCNKASGKSKLNYTWI